MMAPMPPEEALTSTEALERARREEAAAQQRLREAERKAAELRAVLAVR